MTLIYILVSFTVVFMAACFVYLIWYNLYLKRRINDQSDGNSSKQASQRNKSDKLALNNIIIAETRTGRQYMFIEPALDIEACTDEPFIAIDSKHSNKPIKPLITVE